MYSCCSSVFVSILCYASVFGSIFPANQDNAANWNPRIETLNSRGSELFSELFNDFDNMELEILASFSAWSESPLFVNCLNSILFSSPSDGNLYRYNLNNKETTLFIKDAGIFGGIYDANKHGGIPFNECSECGPNGISTGLYNMEHYVLLNQLALSRVIAFDPTDIDENNIIIIANNLGGIQLNSPNDITITTNGKYVYFTDPTFGLQQTGDTGFLNSITRSALGFQGVYRVNIDDIDNGDTEPEAELVIDDMTGPNGLAVTNKYLIVSNTGDENGWAPFWNIYRRRKNKYTLQKTIIFDMGQLSWNSWSVPVPLADGMEIFNDDILLTICPNGICLIDLKKLQIVGRLTIDHLISNIYIHDGYIYVTGADNLFRIKLTA